MWYLHRPALLLSALVLLGSGGPGGLQAQPAESRDIRMVRGLQSRQLHELAIEHARTMLAQTGLSQADRISLAVLVIESYSRQAGGSGKPTREAAWQQAADSAAEFQSEYRDTPRSILLDVQAILVDQSRMEQLTREIDADMASDDARRQVQELARPVQRRFEQVQDRIAGLLNRPAASRPPDALTPDELLTLRYNVEYQAARALLHEGMMYGDQASRNDVMERVESRLRTVLQSVGPDLPLWWAVQADRLRAARIAADWNRLTSISGTLPDRTPDRISGQRIQAELIRARLAQRRLAEARKIADLQPLASELPELDLARIRLFAALAGQSGSDPQWQQRAVELARQIESRHGGYWGRRASLVVVGTANDPAGSGNLDLLIRVAAEAQRKQQWPEAIQALDAALQQALQEGNSEIAWKAGFRAAAIEQEQQRHDAAALRFSDLAKQVPDHPDVHAAHLMACWNYSRTIEGDNDRFAVYEQMLAKNVQSWPRSSSADQTRIWLAGIRNRQRDYNAALTLLANVDPQSPLFAASLVQLRQLLPRWIHGQHTDSQPVDEMLVTLTTRLQSILATPGEGELTDNRLQMRWQAEALLAELHWLYGVPDSGQTRDSLDRLADSAVDEASGNRIRALQIVAAARSNIAVDQASPLLDAFSPDPEALAYLRNGLTGQNRADSLTDDCHRYLLESWNRYPTAIGQLTGTQQYRWAVARLEAARDLKHPDLLEIATATAQRYPRDRGVQLTLGDILLQQADSGDPPREEALRQWRRIAALARPRSPEWYQAKLNVARLLVDSGQTGDARKMLEFIQAVPPGWSQSELAPQFDQLLGRLGGQ